MRQMLLVFSLLSLLALDCLLSESSLDTKIFSSHYESDTTTTTTTQPLSPKQVGVG